MEFRNLRKQTNSALNVETELLRSISDQLLPILRLDCQCWSAVDEECEIGGVNRLDLLRSFGGLDCVKSVPLKNERHVTAEDQGTVQSTPTARKRKRPARRDEDCQDQPDEST